LQRLVKSGKLSATTDFSALKEMDAVSICVPTPLRKTGDPDMSFIVSATEELAKYIHKDMVIVLESTTYPGTTREVLLPKLGETG
jgi:UDP-N-acetyl-D-glucosamine dehydrogenase